MGQGDGVSGEKSRNENRFKAEKRVTEDGLATVTAGRKQVTRQTCRGI